MAISSKTLILENAILSLPGDTELTYEPTERLNFLHGANGSGKVYNIRAMCTSKL